MTRGEKREERDPVTHPLVDQLRFARSEFRRGLEGLDDDDARRRIPPMNCISWNIGHLAWQEQRYWLRDGSGEMLLPGIDRAYRYGAPASTPPLAEVWQAWETIVAAADPWLDAVTTDTLLAEAIRDGQPTGFSNGSRLLRTIYHYWYHTGENAAIRQALGHTNLPDFVGNLQDEAPYRPEPGAGSRELGDGKEERTPAADSRKPVTARCS